MLTVKFLMNSPLASSRGFVQDGISETEVTDSHLCRWGLKPAENNPRGVREMTASQKPVKLLIDFVGVVHLSVSLEDGPGGLVLQDCLNTRTCRL